MPVPVGRLARCEQRHETDIVIKPPWSVRRNSERVEEFYALREGIPDYLLPSLIGWPLSNTPTTESRGLLPTGICCCACRGEQDESYRDTPIPPLTT